MTDDTIIMSKLKSLAYPHLQKMRYASLIKKFNEAKKLPMADNKILMLSTSKGELGGNLLAIKNYIERNSLPFDITVAAGESIPDENTLAGELAGSKYILVDDYEPMVYPLTLRDGQHLVQVWHAMGAFKKFGYARDTAEKNSLTHKNYTEAICSSPEIVSVYAESFGISEDKVKPVGTPRTDLFFDSEYVENAKRRIYEKAPSLKGKKVALFAPTFRGNNVNDGYYPEEFIDLERLAEELGDGWAVALKLHPFIKNKLKTGENVIDLSDEREINDLLFITDVLITDYSSVIFENAVIGNAAVLFAPDLESYINDRGFYFDYESYVCGELVKNKTELSAAVLRADKNDIKMKKFKDRFVSLCDGNSSKRFVDTVLEDR